MPVYINLMFCLEVHYKKQDSVHVVLVSNRKDKQKQTPKKLVLKVVKFCVKRCYNHTTMNVTACSVLDTLNCSGVI